MVAGEESSTTEDEQQQAKKGGKNLLGVRDFLDIVLKRILVDSIIISSAIYNLSTEV
jgi:hypothetical protein